MALTKQQYERYARNIRMKEMGEGGQEKLLDAKVLIIGAGGLGSPAALYLAAAGVGTLGIADSDTVDLSNLQRQILHGTGDIGRPKIASAADAIRRLDPGIKVIPQQITVTEESAPELVSGYDFVLECTDSFEAKFLINDACVRTRTPFCHGSVLRFFGQAMTWVPDRGPCYRCVFREVPPPGAAPTAKEAGVLGAAAGVIGCIQATEAIKYLLGKGELLTGRLLTYDALDMEFQILDVSRRADCPACGTD